MASNTQQNDGLTLNTYGKLFDYNEHCYEHEIDTECLLYNDLPTYCIYYTPAQFSINFGSASNNRPNKLSVIHFNARSLRILPEVWSINFISLQYQKLGLMKTVGMDMK